MQIALNGKMGNAIANRHQSKMPIKHSPVEFRKGFWLLGQKGPVMSPR